MVKYNSQERQIQLKIKRMRNMIKERGYALYGMITRLKDLEYQLRGKYEPRTEINEILQKLRY